jgi:D-lactate dehydrogenase
MKVAVFSTKPYDQKFLITANYDHEHELVFLEPQLSRETVILAAGCQGICTFVNDLIDARILERLAQRGIRLIALRCAGFNQVDLKAAARFGITVVRVPAYSPYAVAEHTIGLILCLNRKLHKAYNRVREGNFALDGLMGFDLHGRTIGIIGTGKIGAVVAKIIHGFGCRILAYDVHSNPEVTALGASYVALPQLFSQSDIITLHCPLTPETRHLVNAEAIAQMKPDVMLINTSRGALIDTNATIQALKSKKVGGLGLDVYEQESELFFEDRSDTIIQDDMFERLMTFPNVIVTGHQAFFTTDALQNIAETTLSNITDIEQGRNCTNEVRSS